MADEDDDYNGIQVENIDMSELDYDLEYLVRNRGQPGIDISRRRLDEKRFERRFSPIERTVQISKMVIPPEPIISSLKPPWSRREWRQFLLVRLPILHWVWTYQPLFFVGDLISGITVAIMHIPQGLAYSLLASLPAVYGLYTSFMPVIIYSFLGTSRHISVGTFAVVELMIGNSIDRTLTSIPLEECRYDNHSNLSEDAVNSLLVNVSGSVVSCESVKVEIAVTLALLSGIIMFLMGVCQFGFISIFLSEPLVSGYTTGAAVHVFSSQLRHIFGNANIKAEPGLWRVPKTWLALFTYISEVNPATIVISVIAILFLIAFKICNKFLPRLRVPIPIYSRVLRRCKAHKIKWPVPIPSQIIVVIVGTLISYLVGFDEKYDVPIVGNITNGAPPISVANPAYFLYVLQDAFVISIVTFSVTVSLAQVFARQHGYTIHANQEFMAYGAMNIVGSFFTSFTAAGSLSRSVIQANQGKTQLVGFISSLIILVVLVKLGGLFYALPKAILASIIWVALFGMFKQVADAYRFFKISFTDMLVWVVVFVATVLLGVDLGLGVGVGFSLAVVIIKTILPQSSLLGRAKDTELFRNVQNFEKVERLKDVILFRFQAPLIFINAGVFRARLEIASGLREVISERAGTSHQTGCLQGLYRKLRERRRRTFEFEHNVHASVQAEEEGATAITRSESFEQALEHDVLNGQPPSGPTPRQRSGTGKKTKKKNKKKETEPIHSIIIDCAPIGFMDTVGVKALKQIVLDFDKYGVQVLLAAMTKKNRRMLDRAGFFKECGKEWLFPSLQDAVHHATHGCPLHPGAREEPIRLREEGASPTLSPPWEEEEEEGGGRKEDTHSNGAEQVQAGSRQSAEEEEERIEIEEVLDITHSDTAGD